MGTQTPGLVFEVFSTAISIFFFVLTVLALSTIAPGMRKWFTDAKKIGPLDNVEYFAYNLNLCSIVGLGIVGILTQDWYEKVLWLCLTLILLFCFIDLTSKVQAIEKKAKKAI